MHTSRPDNLGNLVRADVDPSKIALIDLSDWDRPVGYSHSEIDYRSRQMAAALHARGLRPGGNVAIIGYNSVPYFTSYLGIMRAGMIAVPISHRVPQHVVDHILRDSSIELVLADKRIELSFQGIPTVELDEDVAERVADGRLIDECPPFTGDVKDPAMVLYTSGSTGLPKGVVLSHESQLMALSQWQRDRAVLATHTLNIAAPLYHMNGLFLSKLAVYMGATAVLHPSFDAANYIRAIDRFGVTWLTGIPTMFAMLLGRRDLLQQTDTSRVAKIGMGSSPVTDGLVAEVQSCFPNAVITNLYGTTEHGATAFGPHPKGLPTPPTSIGYPAANVEVRVGESGTDKQGVLMVRSPMNMIGYRNLSERTAQVLKDGWYRTGDVVRVDENGFFYFVGREDDMFVCNGENIYPVEVERLLESHPGVRQACVVPVEDAVRGAAPVAFIVRDGIVSEQEIQRFARENGPAVQYPRRVVFVDALPLNGTNKIDRRTVISWARDIKLSDKRVVTS